MEKIKSSDLLTILASTIITLAVAVGAVRYFAPQLLGLSSDIQLVKTSKEIPPFYEGVFRASDYASEEYIIPDPFVKRAKPLFPDIGGMGPNDILGFRNRNIPNVTDIIIIGDSQTYGNNASIDTNWPNLFVAGLNKNNGNYITHYDMAVGGWGAIEYLEIFYKSLLFQPKTVVVAFYTGNDPLETFRLAYSKDRWSKYQTNSELRLKDLPKIEFPPPESDLISIEFKDKIKTEFMPKLRLYSNEKNEVVKAGYDAMLLIAKEIAEVCREDNIYPIFTIIPTKELVYRNKIENESITVAEIYSTLVTNEQYYIDWFESELSSILGAQYINVVEVLQESAMQSTALYPDDANGHPIATGYKVIADHLAKESALKWKVPEGLVALFTSESTYQLGLIRGNDFWSFASTELVEKNGWDPGTTPITIKNSDISNLNYKGLITTIDKHEFGPR